DEQADMLFSGKKQKTAQIVQGRDDDDDDDDNDDDNGNNHKFHKAFEKIEYVSGVVMDTEKSYKPYKAGDPGELVL
ncbi:hypothetical protein STEG23_002525, partial [Scotinomys teguina]